MGVLTAIIVAIIAGTCMMISGIVSAIGIGRLILMITMLVIICRTMASKNEKIVKYRAPIVIVAFIALFKISMLE